MKTDSALIDDAEMRNEAVVSDLSPNHHSIL